MLTSSTQNKLLLLGRILFSLIFIFSGVGKLVGFSGTVAFMTSSGITFYPAVLAAISIVFELGGGLAILIGWRTRIGALLLFVFTLLVTFAIHHFWSYPPAAAQMQMVQFMKNLAIMGGCLYIFCLGAGGYSLDARRQNLNQPKY